MDRRKAEDAEPPLWLQPTAGWVKPIMSLHRVSVAGTFEKCRAAGQYMAYCLSNLSSRYHSALGVSH